ncbi:MAG: NAD-dependent epimerase/dehydratase family protein [Candidatus Promineifilaceae bacterium]
MQVLITGSSGQIGTNLGLLLQSKGHRVIGLDKRPNTWTDEIKTVLLDLSLPSDRIEADLGLKQPGYLDLVIHFAAHAKVHELVEHPERAMENIAMTFNVLEFCRQNNLPLIFGSSREVYGNLQLNMPEEPDANFALTRSPYAASKVSSESLIYSYAQCYGLRYLVFRFSNVYGRYDNDLERMERVVPLLIRRISQKQPITIYGKNKVLDFTYIDDCTDGIYRGIELIASGAESNYVFNIAYGQGNSLITLAETIGNILGIEADIQIEPSRVGEVTHYIANIDRARLLLGYNPKTPLQEGLRKSIAWTKAWQKR